MRSLPLARQLRGMGGSGKCRFVGSGTARVGGSTMRERLRMPDRFRSFAVRVQLLMARHSEAGALSHCDEYRFIAVMYAQSLVKGFDMAFGSCHGNIQLATNQFDRVALG